MAAGTNSRRIAIILNEREARPSREVIADVDGVACRGAYRMSSSPGSAAGSGGR